MQLSVQDLRRGDRFGRGEESRALRAGRQGHRAQAQGVVRDGGAAALRSAAAKSAVAPASGAAKSAATARFKVAPCLNRNGSAKDTRQVVLDLAGSGLAYRPGDSLGVAPTNCAGTVGADHRMPRRQAGRRGRLPRRQPPPVGGSLERGAGHRPAFRRGHRDPRLARARYRQIATASGAGRGLSRRRAARRRFAGIARHIPVRPSAAAGTRLRALAASTAALFHRLLAGVRGKRSASDGGRGALRKARQAAQRRRLHISRRPRRARSRNSGLRPAGRRILSACPNRATRRSS